MKVTGELIQSYTPLVRDYKLRRARCKACRTRGAVEVQLVWDQQANALTGAGRGRE